MLPMYVVYSGLDALKKPIKLSLPTTKIRRTEKRAWIVTGKEQ